jgi:hypothetical protein
MVGLMADIRCAMYRGRLRINRLGEAKRGKQHNLLALVLLGLPTLLAFCAWSVGRDGALELGRLSNTLTLLTFLRLIMNGRAMFGVIVG